MKLAILVERLEKAKLQLEQVQTQLQAILFGIPNLPHESVPIGKTDSDNQESSLG